MLVILLELGISIRANADMDKEKTRSAAKCEKFSYMTADIRFEQLAVTITFRI